MPPSSYGRSYRRVRGLPIASVGLGAAASIAALAWIVYHTHGPFARMNGITATPDGDIWLSARGALIRMSPRSTSYAIVPTGDVDPQSLTVGADGRIYSVGCCTRSGQFVVLAVDASGDVSTYLPPSGDGINDGVVLGPDRNVWFAEERHVAKINRGGRITEYPIQLPYGSISNDGYGIASVAGKIWFPIWQEDFYSYEGYIVGVDPKRGTMTQTQVPCFDPAPIAGAAGAVWAGCPVRPFDTHANILRMTPDGSSTIYHDRDSLKSSFGAEELIATNDRLWFVTDDHGRHPNRLGTFDLTTHRVMDYRLPASLGTIGGLTQAPDLHIWAHAFYAGYPAAGEFLGYGE
jgi:hypothetical protein